LALFVISVATPWSSRARVGGPSASGVYRFSPEDGLIKQVEFEASWNERGATGQMTFLDQAGVIDYDPDGDGIPEEKPTEFYLKADLDSLTIEKNRALMGGTVRDSSNRNYIGRWVQLVVEDNGDGKEVPDQLSWCICTPELGGWVPVDAEDPKDEGAWYRWWATDAEVKDDAGIPSVNLIPGTRKTCPIFTLLAYEFPEFKGDGQIQILQ
jgi:hypothetical protein